MPVTYLICAAGDGVRFHAVTGDLPKARLRMRGRTLMEWAARSLPFAHDDRLIVVVQEKHGLRAALADTMAAAFPEVRTQWLELPGPTRGQLDTALRAEPLVGRDHAVAVYNCDTYFESPALARKMADPTLAGILPCAEAAGDSWSFCALEDPGADRVTAVREKVRISPWATAGLYYFRDAERFFAAGRARVEENLRHGGRGECYVAPLYQDYIDQGWGRVVIDRLPVFKPMGTPEQMLEFWGVTADELRRENGL